MLYRPEKGKLWDPTVLRWQGRFYLFTMYYAPGGSESYACRLAVSEDGVHWEDRGNVLTDERPVWKCGVLRAGDGRFYMNYGTTSGQGVNDMMGYAVSDDLVHWEKTGYDAPDPHWYEPHERWDHMYCRESEHGGYAGCIVAVPKAGESGLCGLRRSQDGRTWETCPPPPVDWCGYESAREMEVGGFERLGGRWYLMGGICPPYNGNYGYAAYVFESDSEDGPFRPCKRHRFAGQNGVPGEVFVSCLPGFVHDYDTAPGVGTGKDAAPGVGTGKDAAPGVSEDGFAPTPLLASGAVCYTLDDPQNTCWTLPLCRVMQGADGLMPGWWEGNDVLRGEPCACPETLTLESRALPAYQLTDEYAEAPLLSFDASAGLFLRGLACRGAVAGARGGPCGGLASERSGLCARRDSDPDRGGTPALLVYPHRRLGRLPLRPAGHRKPVGRRPRAPRPRRADAFPAARAARHRPALPRRAALPDLCLRPPPGDALGGCEERPHQPDRTAGVPAGALKMQRRRRHNQRRRLTLEHLKQPPPLPAVVARLDADEDRVAADDLDLIPRNHHVFLPSEDAEALETSRHDHRLDAGGGRNATAGSLVSIGQGYALLATAKLRAQQPDEYRFDNKKGVGGSHIVDLCFAQSEAGTDLPVRFSCNFSSEHVFAERLSFCLLSGHDSTFCCSFYSTTEGASFPCPFSRV